MKVAETIFWPWIEDSSKIVSSFDQWKWISAYKKRPDGSYKTIQEGGVARYAIYKFAYHEITGELYHDDPVAVVAMKAFFIFFGNPIHMAGRMVWNTAKIVLDIGMTFFSALKEIQEACHRESSSSAFYAIFKEKAEILTNKLSEDVKEIFRAPWYALGIQAALFYTWAFDPFKGRAIVSQIEKKWNHNAHFITDCRRKNLPQLFKDILNENGETNSFFLAPCFQRRGNIHDRLPERAESKYEIIREFDTYAESAHLGTQMEVCFPGYPLFPSCIASKC
ncbi:MAG: hypothetical protein Tsb0015_11240 [Simkaniaceae bacterium]